MINNTSLQGRLTKDVDYQTTQSGVPFANITVAWSEKHKETETKCFLRCKAWRGTADFLKNYFVKGQEIVVEGKLVTEEWEDNGEKHYDTKLQIEKVHFCGKKSDSGNDNNSFIPVPDEPLELKDPF